MHPVRKRRLIMVGVLVTGVAIAVTLILMALGKNLNAFYSPTEVAAGEAPANGNFRVGGLVKEGTVSRDESSLAVRFILTDKQADTTVEFTGILPDLFREGQGILADGRLNNEGVFVAERVLAKHDENYMPPEVHDALKAAEDKTAGSGTSTSQYGSEYKKEET